MQKEINFLLAEDLLFEWRETNEKNDILNCVWILITKSETIEGNIVRAVSFLKIKLINHLISFRRKNCFFSFFSFYVRQSIITLQCTGDSTFHILHSTRIECQCHLLWICKNKWNKREFQVVVLLYQIIIKVLLKLLFIIYNYTRDQ